MASELSIMHPSMTCKWCALAVWIILRTVCMPPFFINLKLMKNGGMHTVLKMIHTARAHHLQVMLGCMIESSLAITAAAHLTPLVDYADLDGHLLIKDDPYRGVQVEQGKLVLPDAPGLGVVAR